ncbi:unnamed protein product [Chondrus crispus]|uniref:Uncharacterized protein n=1 Tax=Chondrus crispus TaxID=2769 RepID=R7Q0E8_CHOCR|nr:unnamed protein product [Chondrus crispus]CDF32127.1 unnamed protein product [Chondrus crispus]|eukprot:XP_005711792.1 unnamed protein product [Chondrus crispus]
MRGNAPYDTAVQGREIWGSCFYVSCAGGDKGLRKTGREYLSYSTQATATCMSFGSERVLLCLESLDADIVIGDIPKVRLREADGANLRRGIVQRRGPVRARAAGRRVALSAALRALGVLLRALVAGLSQRGVALPRRALPRMVCGRVPPGRGGIRLARRDSVQAQALRAGVRRV